MTSRLLAWFRDELTPPSRRIQARVRHILDRHQIDPATPHCTHCHQPWPCPDVRALTSPYADRRDEWRPE